MRSNVIFKVAMSVAVLLTVLMPQVVFASGDVAVKPASPDPYSKNRSWFFFESQESSTIEDAVIVKNYSKKEATLKIYAVDATSNGTGSFILKFPNEEQKGIGAWTHVSDSALKLAPGESRKVNFTVDVPEGLAPGEYLGGIVVQDTVNAVTEGQTSLLASTDVGAGSLGASVSTRVGSRIYLTVPGELKMNLAWKNFFYSIGNLKGKKYFNFEFVNSGNVAVVPEVNVRVINAFGREISNEDYNLGIALPGETINPILGWSDAPWFGKYTVAADVFYNRQDQGQAMAADSTKLQKQLIVWIVPWLELSLLGAFVLFAVLALVFVNYRLRKMRANLVAYTVLEGENIQDIAAKRDISWRFLAKINNLSPPYVLVAGQALLVPPLKDK